MREIKFRAWDNTENKWYTEWENPNRAEWTQDDGHKELSLTSNDGAITMEQYTGLHDGTKWADLTEDERTAWTRDGNMPSEWKGREIYEGDILGSGPYKKAGFVCGEMKWDEKEAGWSKFWPLSQFTVVGNIHENADLLK